ncbi:fluoride efflux transporter CrcB [Planctomycetota bacterium]
MKQLLFIAMGGAFGAVSRFIISEATQRRWAGDFPIGTLTVNLIGCFLIGLVLQLGSQAEWLSPSLRALLVTGFLGALTTFSTFGHDTIRCAESSLTHALLNIGLQVVLGLAAVVLGITVARFYNPAS